jgi:cytochrome oxidase Cu insertion factor (SCO1/SenC/PrrC family)
MNPGRLRKIQWSGVFAALIFAAAMLPGPTRAAAQDQMPQLKIKVGEKAPDFTLPSAAGKTVKLSDFSGHNVLIDFYRGYW